MTQHCLTCGQPFDVPLRLRGGGRARLHCPTCKPSRRAHPDDDSDVALPLLALVYLRRFANWQRLPTLDAIAAKRTALLDLEDAAADARDRGK